MLTITAKELSNRAERLVRYLRRRLPESVALIRHPGESSAGGGSFPLLQLPTTLIEIRIAGTTPSRIEATLRSCAVPVIGRIHRERYLIDVRTIADADFSALLDSLQEAAILLAEK